MTVKLLVLDFDGVLTDNHVYVSESGAEMVRCSRLDGSGIARMQALGIPVVCISNELNPVVGMRCAKLGIACYQERGDKLAMLGKTVEAHEVLLEDVAYVGNDINDLSCLNAVGYPFIVGDAHWSLKFRMRKSFGYLVNNGGNGAVREVCDRIADNDIMSCVTPPVVRPNAVGWPWHEEGA